MCRLATAKVVRLASASHVFTRSDQAAFCDCAALPLLAPTIGVIWDWCNYRSFVLVLLPVVEALSLFVPMLNFFLFCFVPTLAHCVIAALPISFFFRLNEPPTSSIAADHNSL